MEENGQLHIDATAKAFLKEAAKWAYFLSILGFIGVALIAVAALFASSAMSAISSMGGSVGPMGALSGTVITVIYLLMALLYFFPIYYLFKFSSNLKLALAHDNNEALNVSLGFLKSHYKFVGILAIVMMCIYALFIIAIIGFATAMA